MTNRGGQAPPQAGRIRLDYRLEALPSAQHRAGLAGLVLVARWLARPDLVEVLEVTAEGASFLVTRPGLDQLLEERVAQGSSLDREGFEPRAAFMASLEPGTPEGAGLWTRLWLDWLWTIHRGAPKARMAGVPARDAAVVWTELRRGGHGGGELDTGSLLGSFPMTLDHVPVRGSASTRFLLHFWPCAIMVFLLRRHRAWGGRPDLDGFVAAIPEVHDLESFCEAYPAAMRQRSQERSGPRPREAVVDLPVEAALAFARRLEGQGGGVPRALAYEAHHAKVQGRAVRVRALERLEPDAALVAAYETFRGLGYTDPTFRRRGLLNLLEGAPWHRGFQDLFGPAGSLRRTIQCEAFRRDVRLAFRVAARGDGPDRPLAILIRETMASLVGNQVRARYQLRPGPAAPGPDYQDKRRRVAFEAFRAARERSGVAFATHFAGTLAPGAGPLSGEQAQALRTCLAQEPGLLRTLTLLALTAVA